MKKIKNVPASVRQRLLDRSRTDRRPFNELLQYYAIERFLYRFSLSAHLNRFVLKGALMLRIWDSPGIRPTMEYFQLQRTGGSALYRVISGCSLNQFNSANNNNSVAGITNNKTEILTTFTSRCQTFLFLQPTHILHKAIGYAILSHAKLPYLVLN